jgi:hypothetical protein
MIKLFLLSKIFSSFFQITESESIEYVATTLPKGKSQWIQGKLSDSYENQILSTIGLPVHGRSMREYRLAFSELGLELEHSEIKRDMLFFNSISDLRAWILPQVGNNEVLVEQYLAVMEERGWVDCGDGKIAFPTKQLVACLKAKE